MTELLKFMQENPWLTFFIVIVVCGAITAPFKYYFKYKNRKCCCDEKNNEKRHSQLMKD